MIKKLFSVVLLSLIISNTVYCAEDNLPVLENYDVLKEGSNPEEAVERLFNGESVPISDLYSKPLISAYRMVNTSEKMYSQLDDIEKSIYDALKSNINDTMDGQTNITAYCYTDLTAGYDINSTSGYNSVVNELVTHFNNSNMGYKLARGVFSCYSFDYPQYFWLSINKMSVGLAFNKSWYDKTTGRTKYALKLKPTSDNYYMDCYSSQEQVQEDYDNVMKVADEIISTFPENATDLQKMLIINEWLLEHNSYNSYLGNGESYYAYIAPSALLYGDGDDGTKYPVCEGYAEAFKIVCDKAGIGCILGEAIQNDTGHKWNMVNLDDKWYFYDATWNDSGNRSDINYKTRFMAIGTDTMSSRDSTYYHDTDKAQFDFQLITPEATDYLSDISVLDYKYLDINGDNYINIKDCGKLMRNSISDGSVADINKDGNKDSRDWIRFLQILFEK